MGDGIFDHYVMQKVGYSIAPANADINAIKYSNYVTKRIGGNRAVAEAVCTLWKSFLSVLIPKLIQTQKLNFQESGKYDEGFNFKKSQKSALY